MNSSRDPSTEGDYQAANRTTIDSRSPRKGWPGCLGDATFLLRVRSPAAGAGALLIGATGAGVIGVAPAYVASQFTVAFRATGGGVAYHVAAAIGAVAPYALGALVDASWSLRAAMACSIAVAGAIAVALVWTGPEQQME